MQSIFFLKRSDQDLAFSPSITFSLVYVLIAGLLHSTIIRIMSGVEPC